MTGARYLVVVAGAEPADTDGLADTLRARFTVRTAYSGDELFAVLDDETDVVLVDADLPEFSPSELRTRLDDVNPACQVALLGEYSAADGTPVDEAVADASVEYDDAAAAVEWLAGRARYRRRLDDYYALAEEYATLRTADEEATAELDRLEDHLDRLEDQLRTAYEALDDGSAFELALDSGDEG